MNAAEYLQSLNRILKETEFQQSNGENLSYNQGLESVINLFKDQTSSGHKIIFIGNGGSAGIASHSTVDYWKNGGMRSVCFNEAALLTCIGNDYGYDQVFAKPIQMFADLGDILVAISSSGQSPNIINAVQAAKEIGCKVITLSGFLSENPLRQLGHWNIYVPSEKYGFVELAHQIILHNILDFIVEEKEGN